MPFHPGGAGRSGLGFVFLLYRNKTKGRRDSFFFFFFEELRGGVSNKHRPVWHTPRECAKRDVFRHSPSFPQFMTSGSRSPHSSQRRRRFDVFAPASQTPPLAVMMMMVAAVVVVPGWTEKRSLRSSWRR